MNNLEIDAILFTNKKTRKFFLGTFTPNELDGLGVIKTGALVVNNCETGCHWHCMVLYQKTLHFFDPSGVKSYLLNPKIHKFLLRQNKKIIYVNTTTIQAENSNLCGLFCIMYLFFKANGKSLKFFLSKFNKKNLEKNDEILINLFKKHF